MTKNPFMERKALSKHEFPKHVAAIHISNRLTTLERKLSNVFLWNAWDNLINQETHTIRISDLAEAVGFDSKDIDVLKGAINGLVGTKLQWNIFGQDRKNPDAWVVSSILASAKIVTRSGICEYSYPVHLRELFRFPNIFSMVNMLIQDQFDSRYSHILWEYSTAQLALSDNVDDVHTPWLYIEQLHNFLGVADKSYAHAFKEFNNVIIKPAINEINRFSDVDIRDVEYLRENRRIVAVKFRIVRKATFQLPLGLEVPRIFRDDNQGEASNEFNEEKTALVLRLIDHGIDEKVARGLVRGFGIDRITENLEWAVRQIESGRQIDRPGGFITSAIRRDFVAPERVKRKKVVQAKQKEQTKQERETLVEKFEGNFWLYKVDIVKHHVATLSAPDREQFERAMVDANVFRTPVRWEEYRREGITDKREHTALRGLFYGFAMSRLLTEEERDIVAYARSQGADDAMIRDLRARAK